MADVVIVLVCGGRAFSRERLLYTTLDALIPIALLIHGGASGADALAMAWAHARGIESRSFPADWRAHGTSAGPIRNARMLHEGRPDLVVAFSGGRGTADMCKRAQRAGVRVVEVAS